MKKTNVIRLLEAIGIPFETYEYEYNENELDAVSVARKIGAEQEKVFKTLVAQSNTGDNYVFVIPGNYELDLKKAAKACSSKKIELIKVKDLLDITGYVRGGCSPIGMKKQFPTFIDESANLFDGIFISSGIRGMQILINPFHLASIINAEFYDLI